MEKYCQNPLCENEAVKMVLVSLDKQANRKRALCAACQEVYTWGVQHGRRSSKGLWIEPPPKERGPEPLYRVVYVIDVNAPDAHQAAENACRIMSDPGSIRPVLRVLDHRGGETVVDLAATQHSGRRGPKDIPVSTDRASNRRGALHATRKETYGRGVSRGRTTPGRRIWVLAVADRGIVVHGGAFSSRPKAVRGLVEYLRTNEGYTGLADMPSVGTWLAEHDERLGVEIFRASLDES